MRVKIKILISTLMISAVLVVAYFFLTGPTFKVRQVRIALAQEAAHQYLFYPMRDHLELRLASIKGQFIWGVDLEKLLSKVESDLRVQSAQVTRLLPDQIVVTIKPHLPIASVMGRESAKLFPVSVDGELLPSVSLAEIPDGPILRGEEFIQDKNKRLKAMEILRHLPTDGALSQTHISEIYFDKKNGYQLSLSPTGIEVLLGFEDFPRRLSQASRVVQYLNTQNLSGRIIDARFNKKVVVKLRNEP